MEKKILYIVTWATLILLTVVSNGYAQNNVPQTEVRIDTTGNLPYPFSDQTHYQYPGQVPQRPLYLSNPTNIERKVEYDPQTRQYIIYEKIGDMYYRLPKTMSLSEYVQYDFDQSVKNYWRTKRTTGAIENEMQQGGLIPQLKIESEAFNHIFGSDVIDIKPQGYVEVLIGLEHTYYGDNTLPEKLQRNTILDFDNQINVSVNGKIGEKVKIDFNHNTEATFDFENQMKMEYTGGEDEILRRIEAGYVSLPLNGTLIQGGTNLFGIKTEMQFGRLNLTTVISQHKGESQVIQTEGGAQKTSFEIDASDYDENRHFFLSKYFRDNYNNALSMLPVIMSQVTINRVEVWVTNKVQNYTSARNIVAFSDLGEPQKYITNTVPQFAASSTEYASNETNGMYNELITNHEGIRQSAQVNNSLDMLKSFNFQNGIDWEKIDQARKLNDNEFNFNSQLGFISLNSPLNNDEVLAVAFEYTYRGEVYSVGEFTNSNIESGDALILKLIKPSSFSPNSSAWDLMMKNVYNIGAYGLTSSEFDLQVLYKNDSTNTYITNLPEGELRDTILLRLMNLDNLNSQQDYTKSGDGMFDFIEGVTVQSQNGRIIFPVLEPFGENISKNISSSALKEKYAFSTLYRETKIKAEEDSEHNKFLIKGSYKGSSGSEISLNAFNLAPGSVVVSAGGQRLEEDIDYVVDYAMGQVKIINEGLIEAGTPIQVSTESQELISTQRKTMIGNYASYHVSDKLNIGGTFLFMNERPMTNKVEMGYEPVTNLMLGLDFQYRERSRLLTDIANLLPFYDSDVESSFSVEGEVAKLITGKSKSTNNQVYIDDFEGVETSYSFLNSQGWYLASIPQKQEGLFPESELIDDLASGYNRALLSWYYIDRQVFNDPRSTVMPSYLKGDPNLRSNHYTRTIGINEIYPGRDYQLGAPMYVVELNLAYYPSEKGPYNFDTQPYNNISAGVDSENRLLQPQTRWGGIMRDIKTPNFETSNIEYIEFWLLDPFIYDEGTHQGGDLYINLGNISEDILRDSRKSFENGLPLSNEDEKVDFTQWGRVSTNQQMTVSFDNDSRSREYQDIGFDGLNDDREADFFSEYLNKLQNILSEDAWQKVIADPANDNFRHYRGSTLDQMEASVLERYKFYNNSENNSPTLEMSEEEYSTVGRVGPDIEDINGDNTLSENESYYQYHVSLRPEDMKLGKNYIVDEVERSVEMANNDVETVKWYQFKIPITDSTAYERIGDIYDFRSIRFMRMFLTNFEDSVIMRFGSLNLIRSDWRKDPDPITERGSVVSANAQFEITSINIEENNNRKPINYILPPGIEREEDPTATTIVELNEQSMLLKVIDLDEGDGRAVYKKIGMDLRQFKRLQMEIHAEEIEGYPLEDNEMSVFVRLGSDRNNYYEYEIPLKLTPVPATSYNNDLESDRLVVWPKENKLFVDLTKFSNLKLARDAEARKAGATVSSSKLYEVLDTDAPGANNIIRVIGNPTLGNVEKVHIGIRNPKQNNSGPKSVEVWVNELRVSDTNLNGGWASNGRMSLRLADLGSLTLSGRTESVGWGSITQPAASRSLDNKTRFDFTATTDIGKIVPEAIGLRMPLFYSYSQSVARPEYNPLSSDVKMNDALDIIEDPEEKEELLNLSQDVVTRKSFNVNNVMIEPRRKKADRKPLPTDIENFTVSYSKNEQTAHNVEEEKKYQKIEKGVFTYTYNTRANYISPFKNVKLFKPKAMSLIREFNFSVLPEMISFRTDLSRTYFERKARDNSGYNIELPTTVQKDLLWNRYFDLRYNLSRSLSIDFTNRNVSRIDELEGVMNKDLYPDEYDLMMDEIYRNIASFGRPVDYEHTFTINYRVPINRLPLLDWTSASVNYQGGYGWLAGPEMAMSNGAQGIEIGNTANNNMSIRASGQLNFLTLYNKVPYFKSINSTLRTSRRTYGSRNRERQQQQREAQKSSQPKRTRDVKYTERKVIFRADVPKSIFHKLGTRDIKVAVLDEKGDTIAGEVSIVDENRVNFTAETSVREAKVVVNGVQEVNELFIEKALAHTTRFLLGVRSARVTYTINGTTIMPGFLPEPYMFGMRNDESTGNMLAPSIPFLLGWQNRDFALEAGRKGWLTTDNSIQKQYLLQNSRNWNFSVQVEPIANLKIDFTGSWRESKNESSFINYNETVNDFELLNMKESGNFDMTILSLKTLFNNDLKDTILISEVFDQFRYDYLQIIADRLDQERGWVEGEGYTKKQGETKPGVTTNTTDVIIPAFLAAYTGTDPNKIALTARPGLASIRPNWRVNYNGNPQNVDWLKDIFHSLNFNHSYRSTYSIGRFETNLAYAPDDNGLSWVREGDAFVPELNITSVNIQESFNPLINIDMGFHNDLTTRFEIRKSRNLTLDFTSQQLNEMIRNEFTMGIGYRFSGLDMIIKTRQRSQQVSNDVNMRLDVTSSNYKNVLRKMDPEVDVGELSGGVRVLSFNFQADYMASDKLNVKLYLQHSVNDPHGTISGFKRSSTKFGMSFNFAIM